MIIKSEIIFSDSYKSTKLSAQAKALYKLLRTLSANTCQTRPSREAILTELNINEKEYFNCLIQLLDEKCISVKITNIA